MSRTTPLPKPSPRGCTHQLPPHGTTTRRVEAAPGNPRFEREKLAFAASVDAYNKLRAAQREIDDRISDAALRPYVIFTVWLGLGVLLLGIVAVLS